MLFLILACVSTGSLPDPYPPAALTALRTELVTEGRLETRLSPPDEADLVIYYSGEQHGLLGPCGCPSRPRGGLARMASYVDAAQAASPEQASIMVNGGYWLEDAMGLDGQPRADVPTLNRWMIRGQSELRPDALNVGYNDIAGLTGLGEQLTDLPLVSVNVSGPGIVPFRIVERGGLRIAITGITARGVTYLETPKYTLTDPFQAAEPILKQLQKEVDLVVVLSFQAGEAAKRLAKADLADVVVDTNLHRTLDVPSRVGGAIWVRSHFRTMRMGELRLGRIQGEIHWVLDRKIDLDDQLPDQAAQAKIFREAQREIRQIEKTLYGSPKR